MEPVGDGLGGIVTYLVEMRFLKSLIIVGAATSLAACSAAVSAPDGGSGSGLGDSAVVATVDSLEFDL